MGGRRLTFLVVWALLMAVSLYIALNGIGDVREDGRPVARLATTEGFVKFRPMDLSVWSDVSDKQYFFDGNVVATGEHSGARIVFHGGNVLEIDENTQVVIKQDPTADLYLVTLLKGSISARTLAEAAGSGSSRLKLISDKGEVILGGDKRQVNLSMLAKKPPPPTPTPQPTTKPVATPVPTPTPTSKPKKVAVTKRSDTSLDRLRPTLAYPSSGAKLWTTASLTSGNTANLPIVVAVNPGAIGGGRFEGLVQVHGRGAIRTLASAASSLADSRKTIALDAPTIRRVGRPKSADGGNEWQMALKPGVRSYGGNRPVIKFATRSSPIRLQSLADTAAGPASVFLAGLRYQGLQQGGWFQQDGPAAGTGAAIHLLSGTDLVRIAPYLNGSGKFSIKPGRNGVSGMGVFVVRGNSVIAKVATSSAINWRQLRQTLGADIVYRGDKTAFMKLLGVEYVQSSWQSLYNISGNAYLLSGNGIVEINRKLLNENPVAAKFVAQSAKAVFIKPVEILDSGL